MLFTCFSYIFTKTNVKISSNYLERQGYVIYGYAMVFNT